MTEQTDRELLESAAKAGGIELWHKDVFTNGLTRKVNENGVLCWNPLADDGDALRLAVKLNLWEAVRLAHRSVSDTVDLYAATRRAIVRAAAAIGGGNAMTPAKPDAGVLEDAADPLQGAATWLAEAHGQFSPVVLSGCLMIGYNRAKRLHDAAIATIAARKQGANHE